MSPPSDVDVAIVGGGVSGLYTGYRLLTGDRDQGVAPPTSVVVATPPPPMLAATVTAPRHGGTVVVAEDHAVEVLAQPSGEVYAYVVDAQGQVPPAADVSLYLSTLIWQDPDTWGGLTEALATPA